MTATDHAVNPGDRFRVLEFVLHQGRSYNPGDILTVPDDRWLPTPRDAATPKPGAPGVLLAPDFEDHLGNRWRLVSRGGTTGRTTAELVPRHQNLDKHLRAGRIEPLAPEENA